MLWFGLGFFLGGICGFVLAAIIAVGNRADK